MEGNVADSEKTCMNLKNNSVSKPICFPHEVMQLPYSLVTWLEAMILCSSANVLTSRQINFCFPLPTHWSRGCAVSQVLVIRFTPPGALSWLKGHPASAGEQLRHPSRSPAVFCSLLSPSRTPLLRAPALALPAHLRSPRRPHLTLPRGGAGTVNGRRRARGLPATRDGGGRAGGPRLPAAPPDPRAAPPPRRAAALPPPRCGTAPRGPEQGRGHPPLRLSPETCRAVTSPRPPPWKTGWAAFVRSLAEGPASVGNLTLLQKDHASSWSWCWKGWRLGNEPRGSTRTSWTRPTWPPCSACWMS